MALGRLRNSGSCRHLSGGRYWVCMWCFSDLVCPIYRYAGLNSLGTSDGVDSYREMYEWKQGKESRSDSDTQTNSYLEAGFSRCIPNDTSYPQQQSDTAWAAVNSFVKLHISLSPLYIIQTSLAGLKSPRSDTSTPSPKISPAR